MSNVSNDLSTLDFDSVKQNLKTYLKSQAIFQDYDFEASNINVLLDILAYNTNLNAFYLNMIANEMFLDSALLRDSIISHAKELNYLPRSFRSAIATVDIFLKDNSNNATVLIPRGTTFTGTVGNKSFTFVTSENIQATSITANTASDPNFKASSVALYEGDYVNDSYVVNNSNPVRYLITNKTIDTNSLIVTVIEDNGATVLSYFRRDSLFDLDTTSQVFFIQAAENDSYEIAFGDGVIGRPPKDNSIVLIEYRVCNGELPNGIRKFIANDSIDTAVVTSIVTQSVATGGSVPESLSSIKLNAPRAFTTQERVVTAQDYATLLKANFSEINDVIAYGGEQVDPPQFGKVIVAVDLKNTDDLPQSYRDKYYQFIKPRSPLAIDPIFIKPDYIYVSIKSLVKYNINQTSLNIDDIKSLVLSAIQQFNVSQLNGFGKTLRYSKLISAIDAAQSAIVSNDTEAMATKYLPINLGTRQNYDLEFFIPLKNDIGQKTKDHSSNQISIVRSSPFVFQGQDCFFEDDGTGNINIVSEGANTHKIITTVGSVNYETGSIALQNIALQSVYNGILTMSVRPRDKDITAQQQSILRVLDSDIKINVQQVRI